MVGPQTIRPVARAVIPCAGHVLIARVRGAHSFLPGGGIEPGEAARAALRRELREELGLGTCRIGALLGIIELVVADDRGSTVHSLEALFEVQGHGLRADAAPASREPHLEFYWVRAAADALRRAEVLPEQLHEAVPRMLLHRHPLWLSNIEAAVGWDS